MSNPNDDFLARERMRIQAAMSGLGRLIRPISLAGARQPEPSKPPAEITPPAPALLDREDGLPFAEPPAADSSGEQVQEFFGGFNWQTSAQPAPPPPRVSKPAPSERRAAARGKVEMPNSVDSALSAFEWE